MTTPRDDGDLYVPLELQPVVARPEGWRGRSSSFIAVGLVAFLIVAVALGTAFDDGQPAATSQAIAAAPSQTATPRPSRSPTARPEPLLPPLPTHAVLGDDIPTERRLVYAGGPAFLDLATGDLSRLPSGIEYPVIPLPSGEAICACVVRDFAANGGSGSYVLRFGRYGQDGTPLLERDLQTFDEAVPVPNMTEGFNLTAALDPDGRSVYVLVVERHPPVWTIVLEVIDVATGEVRTTLDVGQVPVDLEGATPSLSPSSAPRGTAQDGVYLWANSVAAAPGGRTVFVSVARSDVRNDNWSGRSLEWLVDIDPGGSSSARAIDPAVAALQPETWCLNQLGFLDPDRLVQVCAKESGTGIAATFLRRLTAAGASGGDIPIESAGLDGSFPISIATGRSRRSIYIWHPQRHALVRIGIEDGVTSEVAVPASMLPETPPPGERGLGRGYVGGDPSLVVSPDGQRLYAVGAGGAVGDSPGIPSGVWVFDAERLTLLDHWAPLAFFTSLAVSGDGRFVYAAGAPGLDVDGRENPWPASVTVYDAETGEVVVVHGAVGSDGTDTWINFVVAP